MHHEHGPVSVETPTGRYISTKWVLGVVSSLLVVALVGWGKWVQNVVTSDHDELIRTTILLDKIDQHITELAATSKAYDDHLSQTLRLVLIEHQELMRAIKELNQ